MRLFLLLALLLTGCHADATTTERRTLVLTGSSTVAPLAGELARRFEATHPGTRVDVQSGGSSRGIANARDGVADIGMVSRALNPSESDLRARSIARDGIGLIVHASNPVTELSTEQVVGIYTGAISRWSDVGGADAPITVVNKAAGRSTLELFVQHFGIDETRIQADVVIGDNEQGVKTVAGNEHALGYVSIGTAEYNIGHDVPIKLLSLDGVAASTGTVRSGRFPLARPLNLVTSGEPTGLSAEFMAFASSPAVHDLVRAQFFVPLDAAALP